MGFAGTEQGSFFKAPAWVDTKKAPGTTSQASVYGKEGWWHDLATGKFLLYSPNLVWLIMALFVYFVFPYDFKAAQTWSRGWVLGRIAVNECVVFVYFGFWHVTMYWLGWGQRPFQAGRVWRWGKVLHNIWYTALGALQWAVWECIFVHCYATGRLPYIPDAELLSSPAAATNLLAVFFLVPLYREVHFYLAHRLIHIKVLYKYVHSLHHRNTDIEPFAGLCMHPIEHLYYFSCVGPALYVFSSPFLMTWLGIHLIISPAASHSGWEDNLQSDQFHYLVRVSVLPPLLPPTHPHLLLLLLLLLAIRSITASSNATTAPAAFPSIASSAPSATGSPPQRLRRMARTRPTAAPRT